MNRVHNQILLLSLIAHRNGVTFALLARYYTESSVELEMIGTFLVARLGLENDLVSFFELLEELDNAHFSFAAERFEKLMPCFTPS